MEPGLTNRRHFLAAGLSAAGLLLSHGAAAGRPPFAKRTLFVVTRNRNANAVYYDVRDNARGELLSRERPLSVYWRLYAEDGRKDELTWLERNMAYGYDVRGSRGAALLLELCAFPKRQLVLERDGGGAFRACVRIAAKRAILRHIHVVADEGLGLPSVRHVDVFGIDPVSGKHLRERLEK